MFISGLSILECQKFPGSKFNFWPLALGAHFTLHTMWHLFWGNRRPSSESGGKVKVKAKNDEHESYNTRGVELDVP